MRIRTISIAYASSVTNDQWKAMADEITGAVEQIACDYAAACDDDHYSVEIQVRPRVLRGKAVQS